MIRLVLAHGVAVFLLALYVNTFVIWQALGRVIGSDLRNALPVLLVLLLAASVAAILFSRRNAGPIAWRWLLAAAAAAAIGLLSTDPAFPAKRIHVPQYALLAIVLWFAIRKEDRSLAVLFFVFLTTCLYGVHDEFLQGLHPRRSFGLRDMFVNSWGAAAGVLACWALFPARGESGAQAPTGRAASTLIAGMSLAFVGVLLLAVAGTGFRFVLLPYWTVLPALAGALALSVAVERLPVAEVRNPLRALVCVILCFAVYPLVINVALLDFA